MADRQAVLPVDLKMLLDRLVTELNELYGERYQGLVLYGSYARGEADEGSDVDLLLLLEGPVEVGREIRRASAVVSRLSLQADRTLSVIPVSVDYYLSSKPKFPRFGMANSPRLLGFSETQAVWVVATGW